MKRLIPPYLFLGLLVLTAGLTIIAPAVAEIRVARPMPWDVPMILGFIVLFLGNREFTRQQAEIHTFKTPRSLVTSGIFRYTRNPMYVGFLLLLVGGAMMANSWWAFIAPAGFFLVATFWYIPYEEANLRKVFGLEFEAYARNVRRWI